MDESDTESVYLDLVIEAESPLTDIWLGDSDGHFVQKGIGVLRTTLLGGDYTVEFGLGSKTYSNQANRRRVITAKQSWSLAPAVLGLYLG